MATNHSASAEVVLAVRNLWTWLDTPGGVVKAVDDVSFDIPAGATLGCVGGSGSGKSTLGRLILNLIEADSGSTRLGGAEFVGLPPATMRPHRRDMQIVFTAGLFVPDTGHNWQHPQEIRIVSKLYATALAELGTVFSRLDDSEVDHAVEMIAGANTTVVFAGGRERLQIMGFAMRLYHMAVPVAVEGDMTTPPVGEGDLLIVTCGPGEISTALALMGVAKAAGATVLFITAQPDSPGGALADYILTLPAQGNGRRSGRKEDLGSADGIAVRRGAVRALRGDDPQADRPARGHPRGDAGPAHQPGIAEPAATVLGFELRNPIAWRQHGRCEDRDSRVRMSR